MSPSLLIVVSMILILCGVVLLVVLNPPWRVTAIAMTLLAILTGALLSAPSVFLGSPRRVTLESLPQAEVLHARVDPGRRVLLLLWWSELDTPRYVELPWSDALAAALREGQAEASARRRPLMIGPGGRPGHGRQGDETGDQARGAGPFYAAPPEALPPKS